MSFMKRLRAVLFFNAVSCLSFGALFVLAPQSVGTWLGAAPAQLLQIVGAILIVNAAHLALASVKGSLLPLEVLYFSAGDILWFTGSLALVGSNLIVTSDTGQVITMFVALGVLLLGLSQIWLLAEITDAGVPKDQNSELMPRNLNRGQAIAASWIAMKTWIKIWLFLLNSLFLVAIFFLPEPTARLTLTAYVASGPLLAAMMIWQRGLTRLLGLAHLIPWLPLAGYIALRLTSDVAGPMITRVAAPTLYSYLVVLLIAIVICLVLDLYDWWRWWRGERFRLGAASAAGADASIQIDG
jgi:hypothetical protein